MLWANHTQAASVECNEVWKWNVDLHPNTQSPRLSCLSKLNIIII